jgi:prepilin-type N-terminal cleavage/methylation domain-containing protein
MEKHTKASGFTLIELLIVVAIIAILAAIAVPNFLEAQTRAKITRVKADMRTLSIGMGAYYVDNNQVPPNIDSNKHANNNVNYKWGMTVGACCWRLTTPVAYLATVSALGSPFWVNTLNSHYNWVLMANGQESPSYIDVGNTYWFCGNKYGVLVTKEMMPLEKTWEASGMLKPSHIWYVVSAGPSKVWEELRVPPSGQNIPVPYDPTNGTVSKGEFALSGF